VDDPNTHLELTMIHEVMVLDHSGPDFAFILYGAALKLWVLGSLFVNVVLPVSTGYAVLDIAVAVAGLVCLAVAVGIIESSMARLRLLRVPRLLIGATVLAGLAFVILLR
jgi:formate hydrogenlyase subunit 4